ncbi:hypothetical protein [Pseudomonas sp. NPDC089406]|uniref:hypothetical protein n=1 Tax=Pseudomonas sp. NPDC089406 TaxID=3364463 RepID=UPI00384EE1F0
MIRTTLLAASLILASHNALAHPTRLANAVEYGTAHCLKPAQASDTTVCEVSAMVRVGDRLILANDKPIPGGSTLFSLPLEKDRIGEGSPTYLKSPAIDQSRKLEAMTLTLDGLHVIASTGFNRVGDERDASSDAYSTLLYWPANQPENARVVAPSTRQGITSSRALREQIARAVGAPFFQVEGLSVAPGNRLLLGIRKQGQDYQSASDVFKILAAPFSIDKDMLRLQGDFELLFEFTPQVPGEGKPLGLSSIEYDRFNHDALLALTSFEDETSIGGYLWSIPIQPLLARKPVTPELFVDGMGAPLRFGNKPEGLEVLDASTLLIVHDDDRMQVGSSADSQASGPDEFAYSAVKF